MLFAGINSGADTLTTATQADLRQGAHCCTYHFLLFLTKNLHMMVGVQIDNMLLARLTAD